MNLKSNRSTVAGQTLAVSSRNWLRAALFAVILLHTVIVPASWSCQSVEAAPKAVNVSDKWLIGKGAKKEGPIGPGMVWLDEATQARNSADGGRIASLGSAEALIFHQPHDSGFGFYEKSSDSFGLGNWACRMQFGNEWSPGDSISSYELRIHHSASDDIVLGDSDFSVELWDGDPFSILETVCTTGGVSAPIPGTQGIIAGVPYATIVTGRVELAEKVVYDCDRVWMSLTYLRGCRSAWRISGFPGSSFSAPPSIGQGNGLWLFTTCESSTFGRACPTQTGAGVGFCCGSEGVCDVPLVWNPLEGDGTGSQAPCNYLADCTVAGEICTDQEVCDEGSAYSSVSCETSEIFQALCGSGNAEYYVADMGLQDTERGYVGSIFAATDTTMSIVPVSVDALPCTAGLGAGVISLGGDEVVLEGGGHNVWLEIMIGDWDPHDTGVTLAGYQPALDAIAGFSSGDQGTLQIHVGPAPCGECTDDASPCYGHAGCTAGWCSTAGTPCHIVAECPSGETCDGAALCVPSATGHDDCAAVLGAGSTCGPPGYFFGNATGTCAWTYSDSSDLRWALQDAISTLVALDVSSIDARPSYAVVFGPPHDPEPFPDGGMYGSTLAVHVPVDAKGTFTIGLKLPPLSALSSGAGTPVPLLGTIPAKITVQTGRCCFNLQDVVTGGEGCLDENQTAVSCAQTAGLTVFEANGSCNDPCPSACGDGLLDQDEECDDGLLANSDTLPDACRSDCTLPRCGDGVTDSNEECDEGGSNSDTAPDTCRSDCTLPICGDGIRDTGMTGLSGGEECDTNDDDACPGACDTDCACPRGIPTATHWGLAVLALLLLTGAKLYRWRLIT